MSPGLKKIIQISIFILTTSWIYGQNTGTVKGVIIDKNGPLPGASIFLSTNNQIGVSSDLDGHFSLRNLPSGNQEIVISYMGYNTIKTKINVLAGDSINIGTVTMVEGKELQEVLIKDVIRDNEIRSIEMTRNTSRVVNIISADGLSKLPDRNAAEVLQRLPGVVIERDQGEGRYVSFRGTPTDWSSALVNGDRMPSADEESKTRAINFDIFPSSLIQYVVVSKSLSPDMEGDAIGGSVNFITRGAPNARVLNVTLGGGMNAQSVGPIINGSILYGDRTKNEKFGWLVGASVYNRSWGTDNFQVFYGGNFDQSIGRYELRDYMGERLTVGGNIALEYKINKKNRIELKYVYGFMRDDEYNRKQMYNYNSGLGQSIKLQNIHNILLFQFFGGQLAGEHTIGKKNNWKLEWKIANYNNSFQYGEVPQKGINNPANGYFVLEFEKFVNFQDYLFLDANGNQTDEFNAVERYKFLNIDSPIEGYGDDYNFIHSVWTNPPAFQPKDTMFLFQRAYTEFNNTWERDPIVVQFDLSYEPLKRLKIKVGGKYRYKIGERKVALNVWERNSNAFSYIPYNTFELLGLDSKGGFLEELGAPYDSIAFPFYSNETINNFINAMDTGLIYLPFDKTTPYYDQFIGSSYSYYEHVIAGYLMAEYRPHEKILLSGGMRIEYTIPLVTADTVIQGATAEERILESRSAGFNYIALLPMFNLKYDISKRSVLKFAAFRSFRRPNFNEIKPAQAMIDYTNFDVVLGNPQLKPSFSWNADLMYEYYLGRASLITGGVFAKYVTDHIYTAFETSSLDATGVSNQYQIPGGVISKKFKNAPEAYVFGLEVSYYSKFFFLPKILKNFGITATYTYSFSRMSIEARNDLQPLPRQSDHVMNFGLFYEDNKLNARIALNYRSPYLMELNLFAITDPVTNDLVIVHQDNSFDIFMWQALTLDFSASYKFHKNFSVFVELNNLTNSPFVIYRGQRERPVKTEYYSIRGLAGIKFEL